MSTQFPTSLEQQVRSVVLDFSPIEPEELTDDIELLDQQIVDSLGVQALLAFAEERLGRPLTEAESVRGNFATIARIAVFLRAQMSAAA